jgi:hypothetical protein
MARVGTPNLGLGTWLQGENPGAGSQSVDGTGLNGNWLKLDLAVGTEHYPSGLHKTNIIDKGNCKTSIADGSSIELNASVGLRVKAAGILAAMLGAGSVIAGKILGTGTGKAVDGSTINLNASSELQVIGLPVDDIVDTANIIDHKVTTAKLEYLEYEALLSQTGSGDPVATVLRNSLGFTPAWSRLTTGIYTTNDSAILTAKTTVYVNSSSEAIILAGRYAVGPNYAVAITTKNDAGSNTDGILSIASVLIRVSP